MALEIFGVIRSQLSCTSEANSSAHNLRCSKESEKSICNASEWFPPKYCWPSNTLIMFETNTSMVLVLDLKRASAKQFKNCGSFVMDSSSFDGHDWKKAKPFIWKSLIHNGIYCSSFLFIISTKTVFFHQITNSRHSLLDTNSVFGSILVRIVLTLSTTCLPCCCILSFPSLVW